MKKYYFTELNENIDSVINEINANSNVPIKLSQNPEFPIDEDIIVDLIIQVMTKSQVTSCDISNNGIIKGMVKIAEALKNNQTLTHFDISHNHIGYNEVWEAIAEALKNNQTLTSLDMIGDAKAAYAAVETNRTLTHFDISHNHIGYNEVSEALVEALKNNQTLISLDMIGDAKAAYAAVETNRTLTHFDISHNHIGYNKISEALVEALKNKALVEASKNNQTLISLDMIGDAKAAYAAVETNPYTSSNDRDNDVQVVGKDSTASENQIEG